MSGVSQPSPVVSVSAYRVSLSLVQVCTSFALGVVLLRIFYPSTLDFSLAALALVYSLELMGLSRQVLAMRN